MQPFPSRDPLRQESLELIFICESAFRSLSSIETFIQDRKRHLEEKIGSPLEIRFLNKQPDDITIHFVVPYNQYLPQMDAIERYIMHKKGSHLMKYHQQGLCRLKNEEIKQWKERLETITVPGFQEDKQLADSHCSAMN